MTDTCQFDKDYFENGKALQRSLYTRYHWMPAMTIRMAHYLIKRLGLSDETPVLDYGCAKGYLCRALRILDIPAFGCDISPYAISCVDSEVKQYCQLISPRTRSLPFSKVKFDWILSKDTMEHMPESQIDRFLSIASYRTKAMFHVIPLGNGKTFTVPQYNLDKTHITAQPTAWWIDKFRNHGWGHITIHYNMTGIKENWTSKYPTGDGFFTLRRT